MWSLWFAGKDCQPCSLFNVMALEHNRCELRIALDSEQGENTNVVSAILLLAKAKYIRLGCRIKSSRDRNESKRR